MSKFDRKRIAVTLAFAALFSNKTSAMNNTSKIDVKNSQTLGAVGGVTIRNQPKKINWKKIMKIAGFGLGVLALLEAIHSILGGFTDSKAGSWSIGRAIKNSVKKDDSTGPGEQDDEDPEKKKIEDDKEKNKEEMLDLDIIGNNLDNNEIKGEDDKFGSLNISGIEKGNDKSFEEEEEKKEEAETIENFDLLKKNFEED